MVVPSCRRILLIILGLAFLTSRNQLFCEEGIEKGQVPLKHLKISLKRVFSKIRFKTPIAMAYAPDNSGRLFILEQKGRIYAISGNITKKRLFLDISKRTILKGDSGLLGMAFDPDFKNSGEFFVLYTSKKGLDSYEQSRVHHAIHVSRFTQSSKKFRVSLKSERHVLKIPHPYATHNAGCFSFGRDNYLYIGLGDGGLSGDPLLVAQNRGNLLGSILRIDVLGFKHREPLSTEIDLRRLTTKYPKRTSVYYRIPEDNPFMGQRHIRGEIWAYGFRNPKRCSFDRDKGDLWVGDTGESEIEEINLVQKGGNYGWNYYEGSKPFLVGEFPRSDYIMPIVDYRHDAVGSEVVGGYVYRGLKYKDLFGVYLYADGVSGHLRGLKFFRGKVLEDRNLLYTGKKISAFGQDEEGELYLLTTKGKIYQITIRP